MTQEKKKLVLSFNPETQSYKPAGHNLTAAQALEQAQHLQSEGLRGLIFDQDSHHRALGFHRCNACRKAVETAAKTDTQGTGVQEQQDELASAAAGEESESE